MHKLYCNQHAKFTIGSQQMGRESCLSPNLPTLNLSIQKININSYMTFIDH